MKFAREYHERADENWKICDESFSFCVSCESSTIASPSILVFVFDGSRLGCVKCEGKISKIILLIKFLLILSTLNKWKTENSLKFSRNWLKNSLKLI